MSALVPRRPAVQILLVLVFGSGLGPADGKPAAEISSTLERARNALPESVAIMPNNLLVLQTESDSVGLTDTTVVLDQRADGTLTINQIPIRDPLLFIDTCEGDERCHHRYGSVPFVAGRIRDGRRCQVAAWEFLDSLRTVFLELDARYRTDLSRGASKLEATAHAREYLLAHPFVESSDTSVTVAFQGPEYALLKVKLKGLRTAEDWASPQERTEPIDPDLQILIPGESWRVRPWSPKRVQAFARRLRDYLQESAGEHVVALAPWCHAFLQGEVARSVREKRIRSDMPFPERRDRSRE